MKKIVIVTKSGALGTKVVKDLTVERLYKICKFRKTDSFELRNGWKCGVNYVSAFARDTGRAGTENKYEMPPPLDKELYFGSMALVKHMKESINNDELLDFTKEEWLVLYDKLMGGFENLGDDDSYSSEEDIDPDLKTKSGYLKDGFVVEDEDDLLDDDEDDDNYILDDKSDGYGSDDEVEEDDGANYGEGTDDEESDEDVAGSLGELSDGTCDGDDEAEDAHGSELSEEEYCYK